MLEVTPVRAFKDNYIWLIHGADDRRGVAIVDPGDAAPVEAALSELALEPRAILATHHHYDHVGGIAALLSRRDLPVYGPARERVPGEARPVGEGDRIELDDLGLSFDVLDIPGHTAGHIALTGHGAVFCGDTLFSAGCGRLFEGTPAQMSTSLAKLADLPGGTQVYCGHEYTRANLRFALTVEPDNDEAQTYLQWAEKTLAANHPTLPSTIERERAVNPFLRCEMRTVRQAAEDYVGHTLGDPVEVFAAIRRWKDQF